MHIRAGTAVSTSDACSCAFTQRYNAVKTFDDDAGHADGTGLTLKILLDEGVYPGMSLSPQPSRYSSLMTALLQTHNQLLVQ